MATKVLTKVLQFSVVIFIDKELTILVQSHVAQSALRLPEMKFK